MPRGQSYFFFSVDLKAFQIKIEIGSLDAFNTISSVFKMCWAFTERPARPGMEDIINPNDKNSRRIPVDELDKETTKNVLLPFNFAPNFAYQNKKNVLQQTAISDPEHDVSQGLAGLDFTWN